MGGRCILLALLVFYLWHLLLFYSKLLFQILNHVGRKSCGCYQTNWQTIRGGSRASYRSAQYKDENVVNKLIWTKVVNLMLQSHGSITLCCSKSIYSLYLKITVTLVIVIVLGFWLVWSLRVFCLVLDPCSSLICFFISFL